MRRTASRGKSSRAAREPASIARDNGGDTWQRLEGGLPTGKLGRIGLDIYQRNPQILYALIENQNPSAAAPAGQTSPTSPLARGIIGNELYRTDDGGTTWRRTSTINVAGGKAPYSFNQLHIDPHNDQRVVVTSDSMFQTLDGGRTWDSNFFRGVFGDFRCIWWDEQDPDRIMLGSDGGVNVSVRRRAQRRLFSEYGYRRGLRARRGHGRPVQRLRRLPGSRFVEGPEQRPDGPHHARAMGDGRPRRRHVQRRRSDRQPLGLQHARAESARPHGPADWRADRHSPDARGQPAAAALQLDRAHRALAAQRADALRGRAGAVPIEESRRHVGRDQPRSHDERSGQDRSQRSVLHDYLDFGVTGPRRRHLGRDRRRESTTHAGSRRSLGRPDACCGGRRRTAGSLGQPRLCLTARRSNGVRLEERLQE